MNKRLNPAMSFCPGGYGAIKVTETEGTNPLALEPESYYLNSYRGHIHNQSDTYWDKNGDDTYKGGANSCVADAFTAILERIEHHKGGDIRPSVSWVYASSGNADGMKNKKAASFLKQVGVIPFQYMGEPYYMDRYSDALHIYDISVDGVKYPGATTIYNSVQHQAPNANKTKISEYTEYSIGSTIPLNVQSYMQKAIKSPKHGVMMNYKIDKSIDTVGKDGIVNNSSYTGFYRGYHASEVVGWTHIGGVLYWMVKNSWGSHGNGGYIYMPSDWMGLDYVGIVTGTDQPAAYFPDIPPTPKYVDGTASWPAIPGATAYQVRTCQYDYFRTQQVSTPSYYGLSFFETGSGMVQYRAILPEGYSKWSNPLSIYWIEDDIGLPAVKRLQSTSTHVAVYVESTPFSSLDIKVVNQSGGEVPHKDIPSSSPGTYIGVPNPPEGEYYEVRVSSFTRYAGEEKSSYHTLKVYGKLRWSYMSATSGKEVKLTASEWNAMLNWMEVLAKAISHTTPSLSSGSVAQNFSADHYNKVIDSLNKNFKSGSSYYVDRSLIPGKVSNTTPITKEHFMKLLTAVNSIRLIKY